MKFTWDDIEHANAAIAGSMNTRPNWLDDARFAGIGPKVVAAGKTQEPAVQFFVDQKHPLRSLSKRRRIPKVIDGLRTDVISPADLTSDSKSKRSLSKPVEAGYGTGLKRADDEYAVLGAVFPDKEGLHVATTAAHFMEDNHGCWAFRDGEYPAEVDFQALASWDYCSARDLYGERASHLRADRIRVDLALMKYSGAARPRLTGPGRKPNRFHTSSGHLKTHVTGRTVYYFSPVRESYFYGTVLSLFPRSLLKYEDVFFCAVETNGAFRGDSGSFWCYRRGSENIFVGQQSMTAFRSPGPNIALLTDVTAWARYQGFEQ